MNLISTKTHTLIGLIVGVALILAPWLFGFSENDNATSAAILVGVVVLLSELITTSPYSLVKLVSMKMHVLMDIGVGIFLALTPWLFNFMDNAQPNQWVPHVLVGLAIIGYAVVTDTSQVDDTFTAV